ncbi:MAG TPA: DUF3576 domain-containing protein [Rhodospirillaceae bacterium]|nr:DUF3576 domain-containing protein [Rhodospirillaceae bacterium]
MNSRTKAALMLASILGLAACSDVKTVVPDRNTGDSTPTWGDQKKDSIFGPNGLTLFGGDKRSSPETGNGIGVNAYLWRASLDTIAFMPLASADPFGGVIITDWYAPPESPTERFKISVFIMDRSLRADGIRVSVFRQTQGSTGEWMDAPIDQKTPTDMENAILTRARELRTASVKKD